MNRERLTPTLIFLYASALFFIWLVFPALSGMTFTAGDLLAQNLPFRKIYADALHNGDSFLWAPGLYGGFYLFGEGQAGMLHPLHLLLYYLLPLTLAFDLEIVCIYAFAFGGAWLFLRSLKASVPAAFAGAFLFTFGGTNLILMEHINAVAVMTHLPWSLLAIQRICGAYRLAPALRWCAALAALTASEVLLGYPQSVYFCALAAAVWIACLMAADPRWRSVGLSSAGLALGLLTGAVQLLPTLATVRDSARSSPPLEFLGEMSLHPFELLQWVNPLFWNRGRYDQFRGAYNYLIFFGGTVVLLLFLWLLTQPSGMRRFLAVLGAFAMLLALGQYNLVFPLYARMPVLGLFRGPVRHSVLADFAVSMGVAFALDRVTRNGGRLHLSRAFRLVVYLLMLLTAVTVVAAILIGPRLPVSSPVLAAAGAVLVLLASTAFLVADRMPRFAPAILALAIVIEVFAFQAPLLWTHNPIGDPWPPNALPVDPPGPLQARSGDELVLRGYRLVDGFSGLEPLSPIHSSLPIYGRIMSARAILLDAWRLMPAPLPPVRLRNRAIMMDNRDALLRDSEALGRASLMEHRSSPPGLEADLQQVLHFDFAATALVEEPVALDASAAGTLRLEEDRPGRMRLSSSTTGKMLVTTGTRYHAGWKVRVDGNPVQTLRADGSLLGFVVPAGSHRIDCVFDPDDFRTGTWLSAAGLAATLLVAAGGFFFV